MLAARDAQRARQQVQCACREPLILPQPPRAHQRNSLHTTRGACHRWRRVTGCATIQHDFVGSRACPRPARSSRCHLLSPPVCAMSTSAPARRPVLIIQTGTSSPSLQARFGEYAHQLRAAAGLGVDDAQIVAVHRDEALPSPDLYRAALITGSPTMVSDREPWSERTAAWLREAAAAGLPLFGVCYGHQLLAHAFGGEVGYHPQGRESGTYTVDVLEAGRNDPLLQSGPACFPAHMLHLQTVLRIPQGAQVLARSQHDPHQMLRYAPHVVSTQFHPEFDTDFMAAYIAYTRADLEAQQWDVDAMLRRLENTPQASGLLARFLALYASEAAITATAPAPDLGLPLAGIPSAA
jgi:GMP synthase (glutamine-hydrolysing)